MFNTHIFSNFPVELVLAGKFYIPLLAPVPWRYDSLFLKYTGCHKDWASLISTILIIVFLGYTLLFLKLDLYVKFYTIFRANNISFKITM